MKKDWKYILYLSLFIGVYVTLQLLSPKNHDWSITLSHTDKNPYGTFVLNDLLPSLFDSVENSNNTFYEILGSHKKNASIVSLSTSLNLEKEDTKALLSHIASGNTALLSSHYFSGLLADSLNISTVDFLFANYYQTGSLDSIDLRFVNPTMDTTTRFLYRKDNIHNYFKSYDTTRTTVVARNELGEPVTLNLSIGKGNLILNCTPLAFTNINMLSKNNSEFISTSLSYLSSKKLICTEYYHLGRLEASTPLRFILTQEPLTWAYYIVIFSILFFMIFEAKRKQRIIPIIPPVTNTSLEFVATIGNLYFQRADHKNIAAKKISFFHEVLRTQYYLDNMIIANKEIKRIAQKTGNDESSTTRLFQLIDTIESKSKITAEELLALNKQIENFLN